MVDKPDDIPMRDPLPDSQPELYTDYTKSYVTSAKDVVPNIGAINEANVAEHNDVYIYIITPEEFNDSDYEVQTLWYYADKVLTDDSYNIIHDINGLIGKDALRMLEHNEDIDAVYVRNDKQRLDYEILQEARYYKDVVPSAKLARGYSKDDDDND